MSWTRYLVLNDLHGPYADQQLLALVLRFAQQLRPAIDSVVLLGDIADCGSVSRFPGEPKDPRLSRLQTELDFDRALLRRIRSLFPRQRMWWFLGNHEHRLEKYLLQKAPALYGMFDIGCLAKDLGMTVVPYRGLRAIGHLTLLHGETIRAHSAYTARAVYDQLGTSVMFGHTHRGGSYYRTDALGVTRGAWENFCCCKFDLPYLTTPPNWQQGFSLVDVDEGKRGRFHVTPIPVVQHEFMYGGQCHAYTAAHEEVFRGLPEAPTDEAPCFIRRQLPAVAVAPAADTRSRRHVRRATARRRSG